MYGGSPRPDVDCPICFVADQFPLPGEVFGDAKLPREPQKFPQNKQESQSDCRIQGNFRGFGHLPVEEILHGAYPPSPCSRPKLLELTTLFKIHL